MCGGGWPKLPWKVDQCLYGIPILILCLPSAGGVLSVGLSSLTVIAKVMGHGRGLGMTEPMKEGAKPEKLEILIRWLEPHLSTYWYKFCIMCCSGLLTVLPAALYFILIDPCISAVLLAGGLSKGPAYALGHLIPWGPKILEQDVPDARGEFLTGFFFGLSVAVCYMML